jgi:hypothetical protein
MARGLKRMDRASMRMILLAYPLLLAVDAGVLHAVLPGGWVAQSVHATLGVALFVALFITYRRRMDGPGGAFARDGDAPNPETRLL